MIWKGLNRKCPSLWLSSRITHDSFSVARQGIKITHWSESKFVAVVTNPLRIWLSAQVKVARRGRSRVQTRKKIQQNFYLMQFVSTSGTGLPSYSQRPIMWHTFIYKVSQSTLFCLRQLCSRITACFLSLIKSLHTPAAWQQRQLSAVQKKPYQEKKT